MSTPQISDFKEDPKAIQPHSQSNQDGQSKMAPPTVQSKKRKLLYERDEVVIYDFNGTVDIPVNPGRALRWTLGGIIGISADDVYNDDEYMEIKYARSSVYSATQEDSSTLTVPVNRVGPPIWNRLWSNGVFAQTGRCYKEHILGCVQMADGPFLWAQRYVVMEEKYAPDNIANIYVDAIAGASMTYTLKKPHGGHFGISELILGFVAVNPTFPLWKTETSFKDIASDDWNNWKVRFLCMCNKIAKLPTFVAKINLCACRSCCFPGGTKQTRGTSMSHKLTTGNSML
jgi:hypothetical protein